MSDTDAFGREREHDPLADMGWSSEASTAATESPTAAPPPRPTHEDLPASPLPYRIPSYGPSPRRPKNPFRWARRFIVLGVIVGIGAFVYSSVEPMVSDVVDTVEDALDTSEISVNRPNVSRPDEPRDVPPPVGLQQRSLLLRGNLSPALTALRKRAGGKIRTLRLASDRIDVMVVTSSGRMRTFQRRWDGETQMLSDTSAPGLQAAPAVRWSQVNASAPRRIARKMLAGGRPSRDIDYLVLLNAAGVRWSAFRTDRTHFNASADGKTVTRVGG